MNRTEHLMTIAMEECAEVAQRVAKAQRFGMAQVQEDANDKPEENPERLTNKERIWREWCDLVAVMRMLDIPCASIAHMDAKREKVERYLLRSANCGTLDTATDAQPIVSAPPSSSVGAWTGGGETHPTRDETIAELRDLYEHGRSYTVRRVAGQAAQHLQQAVSALSTKDEALTALKAERDEAIRREYPGYKREKALRCRAEAQLQAQDEAQCPRGENCPCCLWTRHEWFEAFCKERDKSMKINPSDPARFTPLDEGKVTGSAYPLSSSSVTGQPDAAREARRAGQTDIQQQLADTEAQLQAVRAESARRAEQLDAALDREAARHAETARWDVEDGRPLS